MEKPPTRINARDALLALLSARQNTRLLRLSFPGDDGPPDTLLVANRLHAVERLSRDFVFTVEALSDKADIAQTDMMGKLVTVALVREDGSMRYFNGHVFTFRFVKNDAGICFYEIVLLPWLAFLRHRRNSCLFNGMSLEGQADAIFASYPMRNWKVSHLGADAPMTDACQFDETDYNYLHRRFEAKGWHYRYSHRADGHTLELSGDSGASKPIDGKGECVWQGAHSGVKSGGIRTFSARRDVAATLYSAASFDFKHRGVTRADCPSVNEQGSIVPLEIYEYVGSYGFKNKEDGERWTRLRMEEIDAGAKQFKGSGDDDHIQAGRTFTLRDQMDPRAVRAKSADNDYLILEAVHEASNNYEVAQRRPGQQADYTNTFTCIRKKIAWRPGRGLNSVDTKIHGIKTAIVVGLLNEEIYTDEYGRVLVQFHWSRDGDAAKISAWVRVSSASAGPGYGQIALPRAGDEVIVQWLDSNPDHPIITGRLFNATNRPPRFNNTGKLPHERNLSGIKSKEVRGGGYNQLRLDDTPGHISAQLASSHGSSQLNLGYLTGPRNEGVAKARGNGVELATNESAAIRSAKGLLITAWKRLDACGTQLSCEEHAALMQACVDLFKTLGQYAAEHQALPIDVAAQTNLQAAIKGWEGSSSDEKGGASDETAVVAITSPQGISFGTGKAIVTYAGWNIDTVAQQHVQLTSGKTCNVNAGEGFSLFAHRNGIRHIAHYGKFVMQSQHDDIVINAAKNLTLTATDGVIRLMAKEVHLIAEDGSFAKLAGGITLGTNANIDMKAAKFNHAGAATMHAELPYFVGEGKPPPRWIALYYVDPATAEPMAGAEYEIHFDGGPTVAGKLDDQGRARHENVLDKPVRKVIYKPRPAKKDDEAEALHALLDAGD